MSTLNRDAELSTLANVAYLDKPPMTVGNWRYLIKTEPTDSGFFAVAYVDDDAKAIAIAIRGSDGKGDLKADTTFVTGGWSQQITEAAAFTALIKEKVLTEKSLNGYQILLTGHSLGGGIAQVLAPMFELGGSTFEAPGAERITYNAQYALVKQLYAPDTEGKVPSDFVNYRAEGSLISGIGTAIGRQINLITLNEGGVFGLASAMLVIAGITTGGLAGLAVAAIGYAGVNVDRLHPMDGTVRMMYMWAGLENALGRGQLKTTTVPLSRVTGNTWAGEAGTEPRVTVFQDEANAIKAYLQQEGKSWMLATPDQKTIITLTPSIKPGQPPQCIVEQEDAVYSCVLRQQGKTFNRDIDTNNDGTVDQSTKTTVVSDDVVQTTVDSDGDNIYETDTLTIGDDVYDLYDKWELADAEAAIWDLDQSGNLWDTDFYEEFTDSNTDFLLEQGAAGTTPPSWGWDFDFSDVIGAFYESVAPAADNAPTIADKTPTLLAEDGHGLTHAQLTQRDVNADGQLSGNELRGLSRWSDLNENGHLDAGEFASATTSIAQVDYRLLTAGNGMPATGVAATAQVDQSAPTLDTPSSNFRNLRDSDNGYATYDGWIAWSSNQIKILSRNKSYIVGTDGADNFDANYYANYPQYFNNSLLSNFLAGGGDDQMGGSGHNDNLWGGTGNDSLWGYGGDDAIYGEEGDDVAHGGDGNDRINGGVGSDILLGDAGNDIVVGGDGADELQGNEGDDRLSGEADDDRLFGQVGNDWVYGGDGDDILLGFTASNEVKQSLDAGETDDDTMVGGAGSDLLIGGFGNDTLDGGTGKDELAGDDGSDQLMGGADDDKMFGGAGDDKLWGGEGNDVMVGFTASNDGKQSLNAGETDNDQIYAGLGNDLALGGLGNDILYGEMGDDELQGGDGNDQLFGGDGADRLFGQTGNDTIYGGDGDDIILGFTASNEDKQSLVLGETDDDKLYGGAGHDLLIAGLGNDYIDGGAGADDMFGGSGDDVYVVNSVNDAIYENQNSGYDTVISSTNYQLNQNIEELHLLEGYDIHGTGNKLDNRIVGNSADNILDGITGADTLIGGRGNDTYYVDNAGDKVIENANEGTDIVQSSISTTLEENLENLILLDFGKPELGRVTGADGVAHDALVYGYPKRFELDYLQGDEVEGFEGTCALTSVANLLTQSGKPTTEGDVVRRAIDNQWAVTDPNLQSWQRGGSNAYEQLQLLRSYGLRADLLSGYNENGIANLVRSGRGVIVAVDAGVIWESTQYETGQVNHAVTLTGAVYAEADGALLGFYVTDSGRAKVSDMTRFIGIDLFRDAANVPGAYSLYTKEPVKLWDENIDAIGNAGDNQITGNRGDNLLSGMAGNDTLVGMAGDDTLDGGTGSDNLFGGTGDDVYVVDNAADIVTENDNEGHDTVQASVSYALTTNVENLSLTGAMAIDGTGNALDNTLIGNAGANVLNGGAGSDSLDGGMGADTLVGGAGDDSYFVDSAEDAISEDDSEGIDTVSASISYALSDNVENLRLSGANDINGTGNALANILTGNSGSNILVGGAGDDTLDGGGGIDHLLGGVGDDVYMVDNTADMVSEEADQGVDTVRSSATFTLSEDTENLQLIGYTDINGTGNTQDNILTGNGGNNLLAGGAGNDTYQFGIGFGQDTVQETHSGGFDKIVFKAGIDADQIRVIRNGDHLLLEQDADNIVTLENWYADNAVERVEFSDGTVWDVDTLKTMANSAPTGLVTLDGNPAQNQTLSVNSSKLSDADGLGALAYQWQTSADGGASWSAIAGATAQNFKLTNAQINKQVRAMVSYTDGRGALESIASAASATVSNWSNQIPTGSVTISGDAKQGKTLLASNTLADVDGLGQVGYQWQSSVNNGVSWIDIVSANEAAYTLTQENVGKLMRVRAFYTDEQGTLESVASAASSLVGNTNDAPVGTITLTGSATQYQNLTINVGNLTDADGLGAFNYQWQISHNNGANWNSIFGATQSTFALTQTEVGKLVRATVSYTDGYGQAETITSAPTGVIANINDLPTGVPGITGTLTVGQTVQANTAMLSDTDGLGTFAYQWHSSSDNGKTWTNINGANSSSYTLAATQQGKRVRVSISYTDGGGTFETINGAASEMIGSSLSDIVGTTGMEYLFGTEGNDVIVARDGVNILQGKGGNDTYTGGTGRDVFAIDRKPGFVDTITNFAPGSDRLLLIGFKAKPTFAQEGADTRVYLDEKQSVLLQNVNALQVGTNSYSQVENVDLGGQKELSLYFLADGNSGEWDGTNGVDWIFDGNGAVLIAGDTNNLGSTGGNDIIDGGAGNDIVLGGAGNDQLRGGAGWDYFQGDMGNDIIYLEGDALLGMNIIAGDGSFISGFALNQFTTAGNTLNPIAYGKAGNDTFALDQSTNGYMLQNTVMDFEVGTAGSPIDKIDLSRISQARQFSDLELASITVNGMAFTQIMVKGDTLNRVVTLYQVQKTSLREEHFIYSTLNRAPTGSIDILGRATQNQVLTVSGTLADADGLGRTSYQWQQSIDGTNWSDIGGATSDSVALTEAQVGKQMRIKASYTDGAGKQESIISAETTSVANVNDAPTGTVTISGVAEQGRVLSVANNLADIDGLGSINYQWQSSIDGTAWSSINGAWTSLFTLTEAQVGMQVRALASYTDGHGTYETVASAASSDVANTNDPLIGDVVVEGTATQGLTLTARNTFSDTDGLGAVTYQWQSSSDGLNWHGINGATATTFTLSENQVGQQVRVIASYVDAHGTLEGKVSTATNAVANINDALDGTVTIEGKVAQGQTLTAGHNLEDADGLGSVTYRWESSSDGKNWSVITGASGSGFTLGENEVGKHVRAVASYIDGHGTLETKASPSTEAVANLNDTPLGAVSITGSAVQKETLSVSNTLSDIDGLGSISYQWEASTGDGAWTAIEGATASTFSLGEEQVGKSVRAVAFYTDNHGTTESVASSPTTTVSNINDPVTGVVSISGTLTQGQTLNASHNFSDADGLGKVFYQWQVSVDGENWNAITGATEDNFTLREAQVGKQVRAVASYTDGHHTLETKASTATVTIVNLNDAPEGSVTINGLAAQNQRLYAANALSDLDGLGNVSYQWQSCSDGLTWNSIAGATRNSFELTESQVGQRLRAVASYVDGHGTSESKASAATAIVTNMNDAPTGTVTVAGLNAQNQTLLASNTLADIDGLGSISYQWQISSDGVTWSAIQGANADTLKLAEAQVGKQVRAVAIYVDGHGTSERISSSASAYVVNENDIPVGELAITGMAEQNQELFADISTLRDIDGLGILRYQWQSSSDGVTWRDINGATEGSLTLQEEQVGQRIRVFANYTDGHGTLESIASASTLGVANLNDSPEVASVIADQSVDEGTTFSYQIADSSFYDPDATDQLTFSASLSDGAVLPSWLTFDTMTRTLSGTPGIDNIGDLLVRVTATDFAGSSASQTFSLIVNAVNGLNLIGTANNDNLYGTYRNDKLDGGTGDDTLDGGNGDDVLSGGAGVDLVQGGAGNDTLKLSSDATWSNRYICLNTGSPGQAGSNARATITGYTQSYDVLDGGSGNDTLVGTSNNDVIVLDDAYSASPNGYQPRFIDIENINAAEGNDIVDLTSIHFNYGDVRIDGGIGDDTLWSSSGDDSLIGDAGNDRLDGGFGSDSLDGGIGNDNLRGGLGSDRYLFGTGYGIDTILDNDITEGNKDIAQFGTGIARDQLWFRHVGNNLEVSLIGRNDMLVVQDWYSGTGNHVEQFKLADDHVLLDTAVENLVQAMAAFSPPAAGQTTLPQNYQDALAPVIAANWR